MPPNSLQVAGKNPWRRLDAGRLLSPTVAASVVLYMFCGMFLYVSVHNLDIGVWLVPHDDTRHGGALLKKGKS